MNGCAHSFPGGAPDFPRKQVAITASLNFIAAVEQSMFKIFIVMVVVVAAVTMIRTGFEVGLAKLKTLSEN